MCVQEDCGRSGEADSCSTRRRHSSQWKEGGLLRATVYTKQNFPPENLRELKWYLGCDVERDWQQGSVTIKQPAIIIDILTTRFNVTAQSDTPASTVADLGPTAADDTVVDCPFRQVVGGVMWLVGMRRPNIANAARAVARHSHNPCERHRKAAVNILAYLNSRRDFGITYTKGEELSLSVYTYADYASKEIDRRSISGVAVMLGNAAVYATSRTQYCLTLSMTEAEYVALAKGAKEGMFVRSVIYFMHPNVYEITLMEDNEGAKAMAENPLSSGRSKHIDARWHFVRELVEKKKLKVAHVTKALHVKLFKRHRKTLLNLLAEK